MKLNGSIGVIEQRGEKVKAHQISGDFQTGLRRIYLAELWKLNGRGDSS